MIIFIDILILLISSALLVVTLSQLSRPSNWITAIVVSAALLLLMVKFNRFGLFTWGYALWLLLHLGLYWVINPPVQQDKHN